MQEEIISNRFVKVFDEWICIHDENLHFPSSLFPPHKPAIKLCGSTLRIRANDVWTKLPEHIQKAMVAHEIGHRELNHANNSQDNPFYRLGCLSKGEVSSREIQADKFACKFVPVKKYIQALKEIIKLWEHSVSTTLEFNYRIRALEKSAC